MLNKRLVEIQELDELLSEEVTSLRTKYKSSKYIIAPKEKGELESFLADLARELLWKYITLCDKKNTTPIELIRDYEELLTFIGNLTKELKANETLMVLSEKTNGYISIKINEFNKEMINTLQKISLLIKIKKY